MLAFHATGSKNKHLHAEATTIEVHPTIEDLRKQFTICNCPSNEEEKKTLSNHKKVKIFPNENHFIFYSPRKHVNYSRKPLCPAESPLLRGHIDVDTISVPSE